MINGRDTASWDNRLNEKKACTVTFDWNNTFCEVYEVKLKCFLIFLNVHGILLEEVGK